MRDMYGVLLRPRLTERAVQIKSDNNTVVFDVASDAVKPEIADAVEKIFNVKVESVRVMNMPHKKRRQGRHAGKRPGFKKALVKLKKGEKMIEYFDNL